ncbi:hypothetical protein [uncultured Nostoc sp.]|uniref:hypothetical protein n=1 Tax=uncultured Nostoc sp. TaxID=340711 RepID=UPI0035C9758A
MPQLLSIYLVQHGVKKHIISNGARAWNTILLTFDFRLAVLALVDTDEFTEHE